MKPKRFINSEYYSLEEVKKFNDYILSLQSQISYTQGKFDDVIKSINTRPSYEKLSEFVEGSDKYKNILQKEEEYKIAKEHLKKLNHKCVKIVDEVHPDYIEIYQHTITIEKTRYEYNDYDEREYRTFMGEDIFFIHKDKIVIDFGDLVLPYVCKKYYEPKDLIDEAIETIDSLSNKIFAYKMSERLNVKLHELEMVFRIDKLTHYWNMSCSYVEYKDKKYYDNEVKSLIVLAKEARAKKYIRDDKYVEHPSYTPYLEFLKLLESGEYKSC